MRKLISLAVAFLLLMTSGWAANLEVHFLDVGYADSIVIHLEGSSEAVLIDAGDPEDALRIIDFLKEKQIQTIKYAIVTHPHENHFGGLADVLDEVEAEQIFINGDGRSEQGYDALLEKVTMSLIPLAILHQEDVLAFDSVRFDVLHGYSDELGVNESSLALLMKFDQAQFLFTGDIGLAQQNKIIRENNLQKVNVIQVPHHGDKVGVEFSQEFENPIWVASTGKNEWGLPYEGINDLPGKMWRTDKEGIISFISDGKSVWKK